MENCLKLISKTELSEDARRSFLSLVKQYDSGADVHTEEGRVLHIKLEIVLPEVDLKNISERWSEHHDNFFIEYEFENQNPDVLKETDLAVLFDEMNEELNHRLHNRMVEEKAEKGWKYGDAYDPENKTSPLMKPYHELPEAYKKPNKKILKDVLQVLEDKGFMLVHKNKLPK